MARRKQYADTIARGDAALRAGDQDGALAAYRTLLVRAPGRKWASSAEADPSVLARFALLTLKHGQEREALAAYERAIRILNYDGGKPNQDVLLPDIGPGGLTYSSQMLEAMTHLVLGVDSFGHNGYGDNVALTNFHEAVRLAPDSAAAHFYLGKYLDGRADPGAKAEFQRAVQLDSSTTEAANKYLKFIH